MIYEYVRKCNSLCSETIQWALVNQRLVISEFIFEKCASTNL